MARRGRFTSPNSGGQNLTALIASLLRQKNADEEQALLNAYRSGTQYNGAVPTAGDIQAFYDRWASASGYAAGSVEMQNIIQKKADLNNFDVKKQYNALVADFNASDGGNYAEMINFLANVATTVTDPNDLADYAAAVDSTTSAYLKYQGQALVRGEMTAKEYQRVTLESLSILDPNSSAYSNAIYDAFSYEWQAESQKWQNRVTAGTATQGQFTAWANQFKNRIVDSGIKRGSDLFTTVDASIRTSNFAAGTTPAQGRYNKELGSIADVFGAARVALGMTVPESQLTGDAKTTLAEMAKNPDVIGLFANFIDDNPNAIPQVLLNLGVTSGADLRTWYDTSLQKLTSHAEQITASGGDAYLTEVQNLSRTSGAMSSYDELRVAASQHNRDVASANGVDAVIKYYDDQYRAFLNGQKSDRYGEMPDALLLNELQLAVVNNELNMMYGNTIPEDAATLTGYATGNEGKARDMADNNRQTVANAEAAKNGNGVYIWDPTTGTNTFMSPQHNDPSKGSYQYIAFSRLPDGTVVAYVQSVKGSKVVTGEGLDNGWMFELPGGQRVGFVNGQGYRINGSPPVSPDGIVIDDMTEFGHPMDGGLPTVDTSGLATPAGRAIGGPGEHGSIPDRPAISNEDLLAAAAAASAVTSGLDPWAQGVVGGEIATLQTTAADRTVEDLSGLPLTTDNLLRIAQAADSASAAQYSTYVLKDPKNYVETEPGLFKLKDDVRKAQEDAIREQRGVTTPGMNILPDVVDIRTRDMRDASVRTIFGTDVGLPKEVKPLIGGGYVGASINPQDSTFFRNLPSYKPTVDQPAFRTTGVPIDVPKTIVPSRPIFAMPKPVAMPEPTRPVRPTEIGGKPRAF